MHYNMVLRDSSQIDEAVRQMNWQHPTRCKTWDLLRAAHFVKEFLPSRTSRVLDAGCDGSPLAEVLHAEGYRNLFGCDFTNAAVPPVPGFQFYRGDLTKTPWSDGHFEAVTCLSVIEHGIDLEVFLREMARLLAPGGYLVISADFNDARISTDDVDQRTTYGHSWSIFCRADIEAFVELASRFSFQLTQPIKWEQRQRPVAFSGRNYTFIFFVLQRI